jgi:hypothetical protein
VDIHADEARAGRHRYRQRRAPVAAQHVDAERERHRVGDPPRHRGHGSHGGGVDATAGEGSVVEILDQQRIGAAFGQRARVGDGGARHLVDGARPAGTSGQGREVHHADHAARDADDGTESRARSGESHGEMIARGVS